MSIASEVMARVLPRRSVTRSSFPWDGGAFGGAFSFNGHSYPFGYPAPQQTLGRKEEEIEPTYRGLGMAYRGNGIVFGAMDRRRQIFSQAEFQWQRRFGGARGELFGGPELRVLEEPWPGGTSANLLSTCINDGDLAGNAFIIRPERDRLAFLTPDWVTIVAGSRSAPEQGIVAPDAEVIGLAYWPGGKHAGAEPVIYLRGEFAHYNPVPDPSAKFRGMSWLTPIIREIMGDNAATAHKLAFFENGATPNMVVSLDKDITLDKYNAFVEAMEQKSAGVTNAYKTLYLGGGADVEVIGANLQQIDFKVTQGAGETRMAVAAGTPAVILGISEGLQGSSLNTGNYAAARRAMSDITIWSLWREFCGAMQALVPPPAGARLWVDTSSIPFFQEDQRDRAEIQQMDMAAIASGITAGYDPDAVVDAVTSGDLKRLKGKHTGLYSVQLQKPGAEEPPPVTDEPDPRRALIAQAERELVAAGVRPTTEAVAEHLERDRRTIQRWRKG